MSRLGSGGALSVPGIDWRGYTAPANWADVTVSGKDLAVHPGTLRDVASKIASLADQLAGVTGGWQGPAGRAVGAVGQWREAQVMAQVIGRAHEGFQQVARDLHQSHLDVSGALTTCANNYDQNEGNLVAAAKAASTGGMIIRSGGNDVKVDPTAGMTPRQKEAYARTQRLIDMNGGGGQNWTKTFPVADAASFSQGSVAGYTPQLVRSLMNQVDPTALAAAGAQYMSLYHQLTEVAGQLTRHGQTLAGSWQGAAAVTNISKVSQLQATAADLQANAYSAAKPLEWLGNTVLPAFQSNLPQDATLQTAPPGATTQQQTTISNANTTATNTANATAQQFMKSLNEQLQTAYYNMPGAVNENLPAHPKGSSTFSAGGGTSGGSGAGTLPGSPGTPGLPGSPGTPTAPGSPGVPPGGVGPLPGGSAPPPASYLAGVGPGSVSPGTLPPGGAPGGPGGMTPPALGGGPTPGGVGPVMPPGSDLGPVPAEATGPASAGGDPLPGAGDAAAGDSLGAAGEAGAGDAMNGDMFPMGGSPGAGGAGGEGMGRARQSWTSEDDVTWEPEGGGLNDAAAGEAGDGLFMPVGPGGRGEGREQDRRRQAWLAEDDDLWGAREPAMPPVIGG